MYFLEGRSYQASSWGIVILAAEPKLYIVEDDRGTREMLVELLASVGQTTHACGTAQEFLAIHDAGAPALLMLDVRLPDLSGLELLERLRERGGSVATIVMTGFADVEMAVRALKLGAVDFVEKPFRPQDMLDKVQRARELLTESWESQRRKAEVEARLLTLSPRENEVLDLVVAGLPNKLIADRLNLSQKTVEFHRAHLMQKLRAESVVDLVRQVFIVRGR